jgi:hypothetical protein
LEVLILNDFKFLSPELVILKGLKWRFSELVIPEGLGGFFGGAREFEAGIGAEAARCWYSPGATDRSGNDNLA